MITTEDKTIAPTSSAGIGSHVFASANIRAGGTGITTATTTAGISATSIASRPVANMDETDWTTMLMEMRILSA